MYPNAPLWRRLLALVYDALLLFGVIMVYGMLAVSTAKAVTGLENPSSLFRDSALWGGLLFAGTLLLICTFYSLFWLRNQQTLGMQSWRLQLETTDGSPLTLKHCVKRCAGGALSLAAGGLGFFWCLLPGRTTWHDSWSNTKVTVHPKRQ